MNKSHNLALQSPEPVARRLPVGENDAHRIGEVWPIGGGRIRRLVRHGSVINEGKRTVE